MSTKQVSQEEFQHATNQYVNVTNDRLGARICDFSDQWFAAAENLLKPHPPVIEVRFVASGRWYDGWETRRHNQEESDWTIIQLGVSSARIIGVEVDTTFFNGNHAPAISLEAASLQGTDVLNAEWEPVIAQMECGPSQQHFFLRTEGLTEKAYTHVKLHMYPDGGISRLRVYGEPIPVFPADKNAVVDMAAVANGGVAIACSDQHFSSADNLLLPGRGTDMSDGWETSRSREAGHVDWTVVRLGAPTIVDHIIVDTAYFLGNFPQSIEVHAISEPDHEKVLVATDDQWAPLVARSKTGPNQEHLFKGAEISAMQAPVTHVKLVMIPDGGIKRLRVFGKRP